jgi:hypothetical protein
MFTSHHQNGGQNHNLMITNKSFENVAEFIYVGTTPTSQINIHEEIKSRLNLVLCNDPLFFTETQFIQNRKFGPSQL